MPIRIYAFAKELGFDNKQLLDICDKVNIKGKGSALASLDDDEVAKVKEFLAQGEYRGCRTGGRRASSRCGHRRSAQPTRKISEIAPPKSAAPAPSDSEPQRNRLSATPAEPAAEQASPSKVKTNVGGLLSKLRRKKAAPAQPANESQASRRHDPETSPAPTRLLDVPFALTGAVRDLDQKSRKSEEAGKKDNTLRRKTGLNVKIAAMPDVKQPTSCTGTTEKVQKPDIALPQDAIAKARTGAAPLEQFTKSSKANQEERQRQRAGEAGRGPWRNAFDRTPQVVGGNEFVPSRRGDDMGARPTRVRRPQSGSPRRHSNFRGSQEATRPDGQHRSSAKRRVVLQLPCTVREFSEAAGVPAIQALLTAQQLGDESNKNINSELEQDMVEMLVEALDVDIEVREAQSLEDSMLSEFDIRRR